jgi:hypothetical protein
MPLSEVPFSWISMVARLYPATMPRNHPQPCATMTQWLRGCSSKIKDLGPICDPGATIGVKPPQPPQPCLYTVRMVAG